MNPREKMEAVLAFVRAQGCQALLICGIVHLETTEGRRTQVRSLAEAREVLGLDEVL